MSNRVAQDVLRFKMELIRKLPFYGEILVHVPIIADRTISTACTNGRNIRYNPRFMSKLSTGQQNFILMHEIFHILLLHCKRDIDKDPKIWNVACDYIVNTMLNYRLSSTMREYHIPFERPEEGLFMYTDINQSAEDLYYKILRDKQRYDTQNEMASDIVVLPENLTGGSSDNGTAGDMDGKSAQVVLSGEKTDGASEDLAKMVKNLIADAMSKTRGLGDGYFIPDTILQLVESKHIPWNKYLIGMLEGDISEESSYLTPERKYLHMDLIVPGAERNYDNLGEVWAFIDSSGSIGGQELNQFFTQVYRVTRDFECEMNIAYWDTAVTDVYRKIRNPKELFKAMPGHSGGTDINCVFRYIKENRIKPEAVIILTDGYFGELIKEYENKQLKRKTILVISTNYFNEGMKRIGRITNL